MKKAETGNLGENIAITYLIKNGYLVLAKNHREGFDEIDIIAKQPEGILVFCEVKTINKMEGFFGGYMPEDNLSSQKLRKLIRSSQNFLARNPGVIEGDKGWQIDLIAITLYDGKTAEIRHYKNI